MKRTIIHAAFTVSFLCVSDMVEAQQSKLVEDQAIVMKDSMSIGALPLYTFEVFHSIDSTYGYRILKSGKLFIHQPQIPALPGNKGFQTKELATKCAELVIDKIQDGILPPTITIEELKSLSVKVEE